MHRTCPLLVLFLASSLPLALCAPDVDLGVVRLSLRHPSTTLRNVVVAPGGSATFSLASTDSGAAAALVELHYDADLHRDSRPDPLLLAEAGRVPDPFRPLARNASRRVNYRSDAESFIVWRSFAHLVLRNSSKDWFVRVLNHNGTVMNALNATIMVRLEVKPGRKAERRDRLRREAVGVEDAGGFVEGMGYGLCPRGQMEFFEGWKKRNDGAEDGGDGEEKNGGGYGIRKRLRGGQRSLRQYMTGVARVGEEDIGKHVERAEFVGEEDVEDGIVLGPDIEGESDGEGDGEEDGEGGRVGVIGSSSAGEYDYGAADYCSGRGACVKSKCMCGTDFQGRACESPVLDLPSRAFSVHSDEMVYFRYSVPFDGAVAALLHVVPEQAVGNLATSMSSQPILFAKRRGENGGRLLSQGPPLPTTYDTLFSDRVAFRARLPTQAVVRRHLSRGDVLYLGVFNYHRSAPKWLLQSRLARGFGSGRSVGKRSGSSKDSFRRPSYPHTPVRVRLQVYPCEARQFLVRSHFFTLRALYETSQRKNNLVNAAAVRHGDFDSLADSNDGRFGLNTSKVLDALRHEAEMGVGEQAGEEVGKKYATSLPSCPVPLTASHWETNVSFLMLPLMLGTFTMLTMVVCITTWARLFRLQILRAVHGRFGADEDFLMTGLPASRRYARRDQLTNAEVDSMFPAFCYAKEEAAALGASGDPTCSVCLSSYEEDEHLRRLCCGHAYHALCLDQWLQTNATCPRCRKPARIAHHQVRRVRFQFWMRYAWAHATHAWRFVRRQVHGGRARDFTALRQQEERQHGGESV